MVRRLPVDEPQDAYGHPMRGRLIGAGCAAAFTLLLGACSAQSPEPDVVNPRRPGPPQVSPTPPAVAQPLDVPADCNPYPPYCFGPLPPDDHYPTWLPSPPEPPSWWPPLIPPDLPPGQQPPVHIP
ncbi:hypothetical protein FAGKG844_360020 [Frankia sp. AgKG'84/4]